MGKIIAINYRDPQDPLAEKNQGCWKEFSEEGAARIWLNWRKGKTASSPKGAKIYTSTDDMKHDLQDSNTPASLRRAIQAYVNWQKL